MFNSMWLFYVSIFALSSAHPFVFLTGNNNGNASRMDVQQPKDHFIIHGFSCCVRHPVMGYICFPREPRYLFIPPCNTLSVLKSYSTMSNFPSVSKKTISANNTQEKVKTEDKLQKKENPIKIVKNEEKPQKYRVKAGKSLKLEVGGEKPPKINDNNEDVPSQIIPPNKSEVEVEVPAGEDTTKSNITMTVDHKPEAKVLMDSTV